MDDYWEFPYNKSKVMLEHPFVSDVSSITLLSSKNPFCTEWMKTNGALRLMTWLSESRACVFQVPTGGVPVVHRNTTWSDRSVWFQAGWGGDHPVHSGASISILWGKFWQEKVTDSLLVSLNLKSPRCSLSQIVHSLSCTYQRPCKWALWSLNVLLGAFTPP